MLPSVQLLIASAPVRMALDRAWQDSRPGVVGGHEEGGFVLRDNAGNLSVIPWPRGGANSILVPPHDGCRIAVADIVASFHTHANTDRDAIQEPSETDKRAVRDDPHLKGTAYIGELVISNEAIYLITPSGDVIELGERRAILEA